VYLIMAIECISQKMLSKLRGKRKREEHDDGDAKAPKRYKETPEHIEAARKAMQWMADVDKIAAKWYCNLDKWQTLSDPGIASNQSLWATLNPPKFNSLRICVTAVPPSVAVRNVAPPVLAHLPTFCGRAGSVHCSVTPPLECLAGPRYVRELFTAMGYSSHGCVSLINEYYAPLFVFGTICVSDVPGYDAPIRSFYQIRLTSDDRQERLNFIDTVLEQLLVESGHTCTRQIVTLDCRVW
jgi:hypothetical protein